MWWRGRLRFHCAGGGVDGYFRGGCQVCVLRAGWKHGYRILSDEVRLLVVTAPVREGVKGGWGGFVGEMERG